MFMAVVVNYQEGGFPMTEQVPLAEDLIEGAGAIAAEIGVSERRAFEPMGKKAIPAFKLGGTWFARRSTLRSHIERLEQGGAA
jgi:hypothetical protein